MQSEVPAQENKMGVMPINKLLLSMSLPIMISMLVQALYNVVDSVFVARISENALTAVSLAFPIQNLMIAFATGTGVGINALLSRSLGAKDFDSANRAADNGVFVMLLTSVLFILFGVFFSRQFMLWQTDIPEIVDYGEDYLRVVTILSFGIFGQIAFERLLQATGRTFYTMITQGVGAIINIILDPIMIFGLLGFPKMGVTGAALATVIGQIAGFGLGILFNHKLNHDIHLSFRHFRPDGKAIGRIYAVGVPSIIMASISSVMTFGMNKILISFSSTAAAVFGVYFKLQSFVFMPVFGLNNGMVPIISYNYGARKKSRILGTIKLSVLYALIIMAVGVLIFQLLPAQLMRLFDASTAMQELGVSALRIISVHFLVAAYSIVISSVFQALGDGIPSLVISVARQLVVLLPAAWLLSLTGQVNNVWWAFPIAELASCALCTLFFLHAYRTKIKPLGE
ncbi:MAG: MATE family efflux transporter [Candidatus Spyradocola sp.]|jgi:putative MATE family efflux protein